MSEKETNSSVTPETVGQQPQWPGEKNRAAGVYDKTKKKVGEDGTQLEEETRIPEVGQRGDPPQKSPL